MKDFIFPKEVEFPHWSDDLRGIAYEFWQKWIGPNTVGYDEAIQDIGELVDLAVNEKLNDIRPVMADWKDMRDQGENRMAKLCPIPTHSEYGFSTKDECSEEKCAWWSDREKECAILMSAIGSFYHIWEKEQ